MTVINKTQSGLLSPIVAVNVCNKAFSVRLGIQPKIKVELTTFYTFSLAYGINFAVFLSFDYYCKKLTLAF